MTITLYLRKATLLRDIQTLQTIFNAEKPELVQPLRAYLQSLNIDTEQTTNSDVAIQVTPEEFALIGIFNGGI